MSFEDSHRIRQYAFECEERSWVRASFDRYVSLPLLALLPRGVHPNVFTFSGHFANVVAFILLASFADFALEDEPVSFRLVALAAALLLFVSCVMDRVDGLQARRLRVSNPLGDFYDHGLGALAGFMIPLGGLAAYGASPGELMGVTVAFAFGTWAGTFDRRRTQRLVHPPFGALEIHVLFIAVHLLSVPCGPALWLMRVAGVGLVDVLVLVTVLSFAYVGVDALARMGRERRHVLGLGVNVALVGSWFVLALARGQHIAVEAVSAQLLLGLVAVKHHWDVLRNVLIGTRYRSWDVPLTGLLGLWSVSLLIPELSHVEAQEELLLLLVVWVSASLTWQFLHTTWFARRELGM
ncbi:CDP-alcohol phosphatidyltransferase family protein [Vitiosangium sp. GDMCC 1.1324]|uniref:CDP-alcohol phosphatidyltransferase family protein n=1 Tax=Vitiosangium sp. (strain GDMCC 1.1324) TaxID=2138576 RepID=UPI000D344F4D|nr:CDP-alcohol phosphatidyltransferase family protein [Vitiosangium sp. GDMCC 1.1324]PTL77012.1 hypothetical protein DAT35_46040 [Vitiosangium sp. GDMCC 1.1324]